jgi:lysyl-tRNA synthetase class 2
MLEWYEAYGDYDTGAQRLTDLLAYVTSELGVTGGIDWSPKTLTLQGAILAETEIDVIAHRDSDALAAAAKERGIELDATETWPQLVDELLSKHVEPKLKDLTFIRDYPVELSPFAKRHRSEDGLVERWECFAGGIEIANAFSELNDPDDQRARFEEQARFGAEGDEETQPYDEDYVRALEHGMPPTSGVGLGIDRLVMLLAGKGTLREVILFPAMRN